MVDYQEAMQRLADAGGAISSLAVRSSRPWHDLDSNQESASLPLTFVGSFQDSAQNGLPSPEVGPRHTELRVPQTGMLASNPLPGPCVNGPFFVGTFSQQSAPHVSCGPGTRLSTAKRRSETGSLPGKMTHTFFVTPGTLTPRGPGKQSWHWQARVALTCALSLTGWATLGQFLNLAEPQFLHG